MLIFKRIVQIATFGFPVWALTASVLSLFQPRLFTWFGGNLITYGLGLIMLCMGLTLEVDDFEANG